MTHRLKVEEALIVYLFKITGCAFLSMIPLALTITALTFLLLAIYFYSDHDQLKCLVFEKGKVRKNAAEPKLWGYRQRISLEHLGQTLQEKNLEKKCLILNEFLQIVRRGLMRIILVIYVFVSFLGA